MTTSKQFHFFKEGTFTLKRNGELDILRFVFACSVAMYHVRRAWHMHEPPFMNGWFGVEYFFVLSGILLAAHAFRIQPSFDMKNLSAESWRYFLKKLFYVYPQFLCITAAYWIIEVIRIRNPKVSIMHLIDGLPQLCLLNFIVRRGGHLYIKGSWYLSMMFLCTFLLYPLLLKYGKNLSRLFCPVAFVLIQSYLIEDSQSTHPITGGTITYGFLRGLSEMCLGIFMYEASQVFLLYKKCDSVFAALKYLCYFTALVFCTGILNNAAAFPMLLITAFAISASFSGKGFFIPQSAFSDHLGKLSLYLYMSHGLVMYYMKRIPLLQGIGSVRWITVFCVSALVLAEVLFLIFRFMPKWRITEIGN